MPSKKATLYPSMENKPEKTEEIELKKFNKLSEAIAHNVDSKPSEVVDSKEESTTSSVDSKEEPTSQSKISYILSEIRQMKGEVVMFLFFLSYAIRAVSALTVITDKVCLVHFNYSSLICSNLSFHTDIKQEVVKVANDYTLGYNFITFLPSSIFVIFIGSWSDKYGRKVPIIVAFAGTLLDDIGSLLCVLYMNTRIEVFYLAGMCTGLTGGFVAMIAIMYSYTSDISTLSNRTMKYNLLQASFGTAMPLGAIAGGYVFKHYGYVTIFAAAGIGHILGLLWVIFAVKETRGLEIKESWAHKFRKLWSTENVVASFKAAIKSQPNQGRKQMFLLTICMTIGAFQRAAFGAIGFLFVHHKYHWDNTTFSNVLGIFVTVGTFFTLVIVPMLKKIKLGDATLGFLGSASMILKNIALGLAVKEYIFYIGQFIGMLELLLPLASRSRISKVVLKDDLGKIFSFLSMVESVLPIIATAAVSQIFKASLDFFPGLIFLILAGITLIPIGVFCWITRLTKRDYDETDAPNNDEKEKDSLNYNENGSNIVNYDEKSEDTFSIEETSDDTNTDKRTRSSSF